eukprot:1317661-Amorphochlora_amoeboformis.AAC.1
MSWWWTELTYRGRFGNRQTGEMLAQQTSAVSDANAIDTTGDSRQIWVDFPKVPFTIPEINPCRMTWGQTSRCSNGFGSARRMLRLFLFISGRIWRDKCDRVERGWKVRRASRGAGGMFENSRVRAG